MHAVGATAQRCMSSSITAWYESPHQQVPVFNNRCWQQVSQAKHKSHAQRVRNNRFVTSHLFLNGNSDVTLFESVFGAAFSPFLLCSHPFLATPYSMNSIFIHQIGWILGQIAGTRQELGPERMVRVVVGFGGRGE